jgi:hypothetical protein
MFKKMMEDNTQPTITFDTDSTDQQTPKRNCDHNHKDNKRDDKEDKPDDKEDKPDDPPPSPELKLTADPDDTNFDNKSTTDKNEAEKP